MPIRELSECRFILSDKHESRHVRVIHATLIDYGLKEYEFRPSSECAVGSCKSNSQETSNAV